MLADALTHIENGRYRDAEEVCLHLLLADAGDPAANTLLALSLQAQRRFDEAIPLLRAQAAAPGAGFEACNNLGNALRDAGRNDEAETALREALRRGGEHAGVLLNLGLNALDAPDPAAAKQWLERALLLAPHDAEIRTYAAVAAFESGALLRARELLNHELRWHEADAALLAEAAWLLFRLDAASAAQNLLQLAYSRDPQHPRVLLRAAAMHERCNRLSEAAAIAAALAARNDLGPALAEDLALLHAALASRGTDAKAARAQHEALLHDGSAALQNSNLYFSLAHACDRDGDPAAAMRALEQAHRIGCAQARARAPGMFDNASGPFTINRNLTLLGAAGAVLERGQGLQTHRGDAP